MGEDCGRIWIPRPTASHRNIQQQEERVVINPLRAFGEIGGSARSVEIFVYVKADDIRLPFHGEDMEIVGKALAGEILGRTDAAGS